MPDPGDSQAIIEAFQAWRDGPEPWKRTADLQQLASASPDTWVDAILSLLTAGIRGIWIRALVLFFLIQGFMVVDGIFIVVEEN